MKHQRREVYYEGRVQGVGFRYTAARQALGRQVTGFVRNLSDGRVQLVAEGPPRALENLLQDIQAAMGHAIRRAETRTMAATGEFTAFTIR